jgi:hypothetical protein
MSDDLPGDPRPGSHADTNPPSPDHPSTGNGDRVEPRFDVHRDAHDAPRPGAPAGTGANASGPAAAPAAGSWANTPWAPQPEPPVAPPVPPVPPTVIVAAPRRRRFWAWWLLTSFVIALICVIGLVTALGHLGDQPLHVIVDGQEVGNGLDITLDSLPVAHKVALVSALVLAAVLLMLVVPIVLVIVLAAVALALLAGVGLPLIALAAVLLVVTSPIWIVVGLIWMVVRANRRASAIAAAATGQGSATIRA